MLQKFADDVAAGITRPRRVDVGEEIALRRIACDQMKVIEERAAPLRDSKALRLVLAAAVRSDLAIRTSEQLIE